MFVQPAQCPPPLVAAAPVRLVGVHCHWPGGFCVGVSENVHAFHQEHYPNSCCPGPACMCSLP
eukprot:852302-Pelagomonas_calceolata.AAC.1